MSAPDWLNPVDLISVQADVLVRSRPTINAFAHADPQGGWLSIDIDAEPRTGLHVMLTDLAAAEDLAAALTWAACRARELTATGRLDSTDQRTFTPTDTAHDPGPAP